MSNKRLSNNHPKSRFLKSLDWNEKGNIAIYRAMAKYVNGEKYDLPKDLLKNFNETLKENGIQLPESSDSTTVAECGPLPDYVTVVNIDYHSKSLLFWDAIDGGTHKTKLVDFSEIANKLFPLRAIKGINWVRGSYLSQSMEIILPIRTTRMNSIKSELLQKRRETNSF